MSSMLEEDCSDDSETYYQVQEAVAEQQAQEKERDQGDTVRPEHDLDMRMGGAAPGKAPPGSGAPKAMMPKVRKSKYGACNTGPKGVMADYEEAKFTMKFKKLRMKMREEREMKKQTFGKKKFIVPETDKKEKKDSEASDSDEDEDEEDDAFFKQYKQQQIQMVKNSLPTFGKFERVFRNEFIKQTEDVHELAYVVVHLYKNHIPACIRLNLIFEDLAEQFHHVKFLRCRATDLVEEFSARALPMLMIYRAGEVVKTFPQVTKHFIGQWQDEEVVKFLAKEGILNKALHKKPKDKVEERRKGKDVDPKY